LVIVSRPLDLPDLPNLADQWALQNGQAEAAFQELGSPYAEQAHKDRERIERNQ